MILFHEDVILIFPFNCIRSYYQTIFFVISFFIKTVGIIDRKLNALLYIQFIFKVLIYNLF